MKEIDKLELLKTSWELHSQVETAYLNNCAKQGEDEWLEKQQDLLLPVPYFLLTFTLPDELRTLARSHQRLFYSTLFRTSAAAAKRLALDPKYV